MKQFVFIFFVIIILVACTDTKGELSESSDTESKNKGAYTEYFFPTDSVKPFIYVFQNTKDPLDEKVLRIYRSEEKEDTNLIVEHYNSDLKITEGFTHSLNNNFSVIDHMIVDGDGLKRQANLNSNTFFPNSKVDHTKFLSDFPSHLDSITMIYQSVRSVLEDDTTTDLFGEEVPAIIVKDSVKVLMANPFTKQSSDQNVVINRVYAKGYGLVEWYSNDKKTVYKLAKIRTNNWWIEYAIDPQIKP